MLIFQLSFVIPNSSLRLKYDATFALWMMFLLGRHAMFGQEPPTYFRSITAVFIPFLASVQERSLPAAPLPRMSKSYSSTSIAETALPLVAVLSKCCVVFISFCCLVIRFAGLHTVKLSQSRNVCLLCRPAPIHCQDASGDKWIFQQRDHGLRGFLTGANPPNWVQASQPVALSVSCLRFSHHTVNHWSLDRAEGHRVHADPLFCKLQGGRPSQTIHSVLGGGINTETGHADLSDDRGG